MEPDYVEAVINEVRSAQKALRRAHRLLLIYHEFDDDNEVMVLLWVISDFVYDLVDYLVERHFASQAKNENTLFPKEESVFSRGVLEWFGNHFNSHYSRLKNHPK